MDTTPSATTRTAIVIAGGAMHTAPDITIGDMVIAADSGYDHAMARSITVDLLVGDMDSISPEGLRHATDTGVRIERHPIDKDATDLELAIEAALATGADVIEIHGAEDGRIAHLLTVALQITGANLLAIPITWHTATGRVTLATPERALTIDAPVGWLVSLVPVGDVAGVTTRGLQWQLTDDDLPAGSTRGLGNVIVTPPASIRVTSGTILVITEEGAS